MTPLSAAVPIEASDSGDGRRGWRRRGSRLLGAWYLVLLAAATLTLSAAWLADWQLDIVESDSMKPTVPRHSLAVVAPAAGGRVRTGDIVTFADPKDRRRLVLHRVVAILEQPEGRFLRTRGDANVTADPSLIRDVDVRGRMRWHLPRAGVLVRALRPPLGLLVLVGIPLLVFLANEMVLWRRRRESRSREGQWWAGVSATAGGDNQALLAPHRASNLLRDALAQRQGTVHASADHQRYGASFGVTATEPAAAVAKSVKAFRQAAAAAGLPDWPVVDVHAHAGGQKLPLGASVSPDPSSDHATADSSSTTSWDADEEWSRAMRRVRASRS